jgi:hypothetical protein
LLSGSKIEKISMGFVDNFIGNNSGLFLWNN